MRGFLLAAAIAIGLPLTTSSPATSSAQTDRVTRIFVHRDGTAEAIPNATVTMSLLSGPASAAPPQNISTSTDSAGMATFKDLSGGEVTAQVNCDGYLGSQGQQYVYDSFTIDVSKKDQQVDVAMIKGATISGRVVDEQGQPIAGVQIRTYIKGYADGRPSLIGVSPPGTFAFNPRTTDDRGEFRLFWLGPGEYYVQEQVPPGPARLQRWDNHPPLPATESYYPGTIDIAKALPVTLKAGEERTAVDFTVPFAGGFTISGVVVNPVPGGQTMPNGQAYRSISGFSLIPHGSPIEPKLLSNAVRTADPNNLKFELRDIPPGSYDLYPLFPIGTPGQRLGDATARTPIEVRDRDVDNLRITLRPNLDLNGRVIFDGDMPPKGFNSIRVQLRPRELLPGSVVGFLHQPVSTADTLDPKTRTFVLSGVMEASFAVVVSGLPPDSYVADIRLGSASIYDSGTVSVSRTLQDPLDLIVRTGGGSIEGTVQGDAVQPAVLLIPSGNRRTNPSLYKHVYTDPFGKFTITGIAPGEYRLIAMELVPGGNAEEDPDFIAPYASHAATVTIAAGQKTSVQLTLSKP